MFVKHSMYFARFYLCDWDQSLRKKEIFFKFVALNMSLIQGYKIFEPCGLKHVIIFVCYKNFLLEAVF